MSRKVSYGWLRSYIKAMLPVLEIFKIIIITGIGLSPSGSGYFTCVQHMKLVTNKFKSGGLHEKHVVATWDLGTDTFRTALVYSVTQLN